MENVCKMKEKLPENDWKIAEHDQKMVGRWSENDWKVIEERLEHDQKMMGK